MRKALLKKKFNAGFVKTVTLKNVDMIYDETTGEYYTGSDIGDSFTITDNTGNNTGTYTIKYPTDTNIKELILTRPYLVYVWGDSNIPCFVFSPSDEYFFHGTSWIGGNSSSGFLQYKYNLTTGAWTRYGSAYGSVPKENHIYFNADIYRDTNKTSYYFQDDPNEPVHTIPLEAEYIQEEASGKDIRIENGDQRKGVEIIKLYGESIQNGVPTPTNPVSIIPVTGEQKVSVNERNYNFTLPNEYCSLPNGVMDTIEKINGVWKRAQRIGKKVFNGTEQWTVTGTTPQVNTIRCSTPFTPMAKEGTEQYSYCSHFSYTNDTSIDRENYFGAFLPTESYIALRLDKNKVTTLTEFKNWLASNNVTIYYLLATPVYTEITDTALLDFLNNFELDNGRNEIQSTMPLDMIYNCVGFVKTLIDGKEYFIRINKDLETGDKLWLDTENNTVEVEKNSQESKADCELINEETKVFSVYDRNYQISGEQLLYRDRKKG